jgi:hypothetical protein
MRGSSSPLSEVGWSIGGRQPSVPLTTNHETHETHETHESMTGLLGFVGFVHFVVFVLET